MLNNIVPLVKTTCSNIAIWLAVVSFAYVTGYFFVVQPRLLNPFISFNGKPLPLTAHYRVSGPVVKALYGPFVRLDQTAFPKRWEWPSAKECHDYLTKINHGMDRFQLYDEMVRAQADAVDSVQKNWFANPMKRGLD